MTPTQRLFTDEQGGEIVGFTAGRAVVRYGKRLRLENLEDILLLDPQDLLDEAVQALEERELLWRDADGMRRATTVNLGPNATPKTVAQAQLFFDEVKRWIESGSAAPITLYRPET